jgi:hypothetical protein
VDRDTLDTPVGEVDRETIQTLLGTAWVGFGLLQAGYAVVVGVPVMAALGVAFAVLGALYYWAEVHRSTG